MSPTSSFGQQVLPRLWHQCLEAQNYAAICSIKVGSSLGARELFTRRDTEHTCK
jgi:hypothetical protein